MRKRSCSASNSTRRRSSCVGSSIAFNVTTGPKPFENARHAAAPSRSGLREFVGFPYADLLHGQLEQLDLTASRVNGAANVLTIETVGGGGGRALELAAERQDRRVVDDVRIWMEDADKALIPQQTLQELVEWLKEEYP